MSFNQVRGGLPMFITAGVVLRTRQMQLQIIRQAQEEQAYLEHADVYDNSMQPDGDGSGSGSGSHGGVPQQEPAFGQNWYQTN